MLETRLIVWTKLICVSQFYAHYFLFPGIKPSAVQFALLNVVEQLMSTIHTRTVMRRALLNRFVSRRKILRLTALEHESSNTIKGKVRKYSQIYRSLFFLYDYLYRPKNTHDTHTHTHTDCIYKYRDAIEHDVKHFYDQNLNPYIFDLFI